MTSTTREWVRHSNNGCVTTVDKSRSRLNPNGQSDAWLQAVFKSD